MNTLSFLSLFIQHHNNLNQVVQRHIDEFSLQQLFTNYSTFSSSFRTRQINELKFWMNFCIRSVLMRFKINDKNTMRSCRHFIHWCVWNCSVCMTDKKQIQCILFSLCSVNWEILKNELTFFIFKHSDMRKVFKVLTIVICIKQIKPILIINLHIADSTLIGCLSVFLNSFKNIPQSSRNDPSLLILFFSSSDCVRLSWSCLAIRKNSSIISFKCLINYFLCHSFKYSFLTCVSIKDCIEVIILINSSCVINHISFEVFLKFKSYFSIIGINF